jgi:hypothetical protein
MTTLGTTTTYDGTEHAYLRGHKVRIIAVLKNALRDDYDPDRDGMGSTSAMRMTSSARAALPPTTASRCSPGSQQRDASASCRATRAPSTSRASRA